ncbi:MAG TPA: prevent-host-death protein [Dehalococcoidia bacterium]|nr:prevent-host-death protein [Dehalococcoidia bacterium]
MNTIPAREIKRRGISAVDELLKCGPVHVIKNDSPSYVIMDEVRYRDLIDAEEEAGFARIKESMAEVKAGLARPMTAEELIAEFGLDE